MRVIGYISWEIRGATPIYEDDPEAERVAEMTSDELWQIIDRTDDVQHEASWEPNG
jgi:hypothetical protein